MKRRILRAIVIAAAVFVTSAFAVFWSSRHDVARVQKSIRENQSPEYPGIVASAFIAAEDPDFLQHGHFYTLTCLLQMLTADLRHDPAIPHASLTNQVVKVYTADYRQFRRASTELLTSAVIDAITPKELVVRAYLNTVYLGTVDHTPIIGVEAASRTYFGKGATSLTVAEIARLAAAVRSPHVFSPSSDSPRAIARRRLVLDRLYAAGQISREDFQKAKSSVGAAPPNSTQQLSRPALWPGGRAASGFAVACVNSLSSGDGPRS